MTVTIRRPQRRPAFHALTVAAVDRLTEDAVMVTFAVPEALRDEFEFRPGQHLTVRLAAGLALADARGGAGSRAAAGTGGQADNGADSRADAGTGRQSDNGADSQGDSGASGGADTGGAGAGDEIRRSYSICSTPTDLREHGVLRVGVREVAGGTFSGYATTRLRGGDIVDVLPPLGRFTTALDPGRRRHYAAVVAGSGITPVLSLVACALATEPDSAFTLLYGNRTSASVMFAEELADLKDRYRNRLQVVHVLSREPQLSSLLSGRLDGERLGHILASGLVDAGSVDEWFLCGPYEMVIEARAVLAGHSVPDGAVKTELFHVEALPAPARIRPAAGPDGPATTVTIVLDGRESTFTMARDSRVLDAALRVRAELPYACKGGVCSTCRAKVIEGSVEMARNYALEPEDVAAGYVLTCQSEPVTERLVVDYDA